MSQFVGILQEEGRGGVVLPQGQPDMGAIHIAAADLKGAPYGMLVVIDLISPPDAEILRGTIAEVLGDPGRPDVAMEAIIRQHGLSEKFPEAVLAEAEKMPKSLSPELLKSEISLGRRDLRELKTMTIDGLDARDLDDAVSIKAEGNEGFRLWVHIADVTYYVKEDSPLDREAYHRGTSVYLADRVLPMLPPQLSNGICSLNPGQDRLAMTCEMVFDKNGEQVDGDIYESVIRSDLRANYEDVKRSLEGDIPADYAVFGFELQLMERLAKLLESNAEQRGALEFDFPETKVEMDNDGKVKDIYPYPVSFANEIIEQFMIAANRFVARTFKNLGLPFMYRVHDYPDPEKLERFKEALRMQGKKIRLSPAPQPAELASVLEDLEAMPGSQALQNLLLRSLAKAVYAAQPLGHYGLALKDYAHFTSPIRRYPDLFIHRVIRGYLRADGDYGRWRQKAPEAAEHCSLCERTAVEAERDSVDQKVVEYYAERLGEVYDAEVTGFVAAGMFVMLPSSAEGMIPFREMDDYYVYDELSMTARGRASGRVFRIGDRLRVRIARADVVLRQLDLVPLNEQEAGRIVPDNKSGKERGGKAPSGRKNKSGGRSRDEGRRGSGKKNKRKSSKEKDGGAARSRKKSTKKRKNKRR